MRSPKRKHHSISNRIKRLDQDDNFSPTQGGGIFCAYCGYATDFDESILRQVNLDGFLSGVSGVDGIPTNYLTASFADAFAQLNSDAAISDPNRSGRGALGDAALRARRDASNSIFGFYDPERNPAASFKVAEMVSAAFFNAAWESTLGDVPYAANFGFRVAHTETSSSGVDQPVVQFRESDGDTQLIPVFGGATDVRIQNSYTNFLPSANIKFDVAEDKIVRLAASKTVTRPTLTALGVSNQFGGRANAPTSSGGNPNLEAFTSTNFDAAFEWYVDDLSFFGVTGFYKDFGNFLESQTISHHTLSTSVVFMKKAQFKHVSLIIIVINSSWRRSLIKVNRVSAKPLAKLTSLQLMKSMRRSKSLRKASIFSMRIRATFLALRTVY